MTQTNDVLQTILSNFPENELGSDEQKRVFQAIKSRLIEAPDAVEELKVLYKVKGFSEFATGFMWMMDRAGKSSSQSEIGPEDETLLLSSFRKGVEGTTAPAEVAAPVGGAGEEKTLASLVEQFSDAVQSGSGQSKMLLQDVLSECESVGTKGGGEEIVELSTLLAQFLLYISQIDLLDDVRVINIVSHVSSLLTQWSSAPESARQGILEEALGSLRDFKSHFE